MEIKKKPYTTKSGKTQFMPEIPNLEHASLGDFDDLGWCLGCGEEAYGVEPDARGYTCESCDAKKVYGLQELMLMGLVA